jgi:hypothetical protein
LPQVEAALAPVAAENIPAAHATHASTLTALAAVEKRPAAQLVHADAPA